MTMPYHHLGLIPKWNSTKISTILQNQLIFKYDNREVGQCQIPDNSHYLTPHQVFIFIDFQLKIKLDITSQIQNE